MQKAGALLLILATMSGVGLGGQAPTEPRTRLLFVDDLHLEFVRTPRTRELTRRLLKD
jgi:hypothetical protein